MFAAKTKTPETTNLLQCMWCASSALIFECASVNAINAHDMSQCERAYSTCTVRLVKEWTCVQPL